MRTLLCLELFDGRIWKAFFLQKRNGKFKYNVFIELLKLASNSKINYQSYVKNQTEYL